MYARALLLAVSVTISGVCGVEDWRPVGQGDPLRDPTHVYSPPQVAHVHYWLKAPSIALEPPPSRIFGLSQVAGWPQVTAHYLGNNNNQPTTTPVSITTAYPDGFQYQIIKSPHSSPFVEKNSVFGPALDRPDAPIFVKPTVPDPPPPFFSSSSTSANFFPSSSSSTPAKFFPTSTSLTPAKYFTTPPPKKPLVFHNSYRPTMAPPSSLTPRVPSPVQTDNFAAPSFVKHISTTVVYDTTTAASTSTTTTQRPLNFVIEGHSKVKKYGPLPESSTSIHRVTHNHLVTNLVAKDDKGDLDKYNPFRL